MIALVLGCQASDQQSISVAMQLDADSCGASASDLQLNCSGTVWLHVSDAAGETIASDCVDVSGDTQPLTDLAGILGSQLDLGSLPANRELRIQLSVYDLQFGECPKTAPLEAPFISGQSALVKLGEADDDILLNLVCSSDSSTPEEPLPGNEPCADCEGLVEECLGLNSANSCSVIQQQCNEECSLDGGPDCSLPCQVYEQRCFDNPGGVPVLDCQGVTEECFQLCKNDPKGCIAACQDVGSFCEQISETISACEQSGDDCFLNCDVPSGCLSFRG